MYLSIGTTTESPGYKEGSPENITKALKGFERNVKLLKTQNVSDTELENAKTRYKTQILHQMETNSNRNRNFTASKVSPYGINYYLKLFKAIEKITAKDIKAAANYVFKNPPVTSIVASKNTLKTLKLI